MARHGRRSRSNARPSQPVFVSAIFVLFGAWEQTSSIQGILTLGEIAWEASLGIYLIVKGFRPSPILNDASFAGGR